MKETPDGRTDLEWGVFVQTVDYGKYSVAQDFSGCQSPEVSVQRVGCETSPNLQKGRKE